MKRDVAMLVSIVTVVYNEKYSLEKTINSVIKHRNEYLEYIIIDGGSTDGTIDLLEKYDREIDYWQSEPDMGIYDAMNKSIKLARGKYILNINVGDELLYVPFDLLKKNMEGSVCAVCMAVQVRENKIIYPKVSFWLKLENTIPHQGCFYNVDILKDNNYNIMYNVFADYDLNQRLYKKKYSFVTYDIVVAFHSPGGISFNKKYAGEFFKIISKNYGVACVVLSYLKFKYNAIKYLFTYKLWKRLC